MRSAAGLLLLLLSGAAGAEAPVERTRSVQLGPDVDGPSDPLPLYFDQRLTLVLPERVRLAVPGSPDVLTAAIRDQLVVLSLVDSDWVRAKRPTTNLTVLTEGGTAFTCRVAVARTADEASIDLVRVLADPSVTRRAGPEAVALVTAWLRDGAAGVPVEVAPLFAPLAAEVDARARHQVAGGVAVGGAERLADARRTKQDFIYLTSHGLVRVGPFLLARLTAANHTQPPFTIGAVSVAVDGRPLDALVEIPDRVVPPDGEPRGLGVLFPADALPADATLGAEVCEQATVPRCVSLVIR